MLQNGFTARKVMHCTCMCTHMHVHTYARASGSLHALAKNYLSKMNPYSSSKWNAIEKVPGSTDVKVLDEISLKPTTNITIITITLICTHTCTTAQSVHPLPKTQKLVIRLRNLQLFKCSVVLQII